MELSIDISGASPTELERGLSAVMMLLAAAGLTVEELVHGYLVCEAWAVSGCNGPIPSAEHLRAAELWDAADGYAVEIACHGWPKKPKSANLWMSTTGLVHMT